MTGSGMLGQTAKRRGLRVMLVDTFLLWGGFFMLVPLVAVHYVDGLGWPAATVGGALAVRQLAQQGIAPLSGPLADRFGAKRLLCGGLLVRAGGFVLVTRADTPALLLLALALAAVGGGLFETPELATIAALTDEAERPRTYALVGTVAAVGTAVGTQAGVLLLGVDFAAVALAAAGCFAAAFVLTALALPEVAVGDAERSPLGNLARVLRDRPFVTYTVLLAGFWFVWVQFSLSLPLRAADVAGEGALRWVFALNTGLTVLLGYALPRLAERRLRPRGTLVLGVALAALGYGGLAFVGDASALLGCVALVAVGTVLAYPSQQAVAADLADPKALGSYLGVNALALAVGGGLGNVAGGWLYDVGDRLGVPALPWLAIGGVGMATAAGLALTAAVEAEGR